MIDFNIIDVIKDSSVTRTIWKQELNQTKDVELLKKLLDSYVQSAMINLSNEESDYTSFYQDVLQRFKEDNYD